MSPPSVENPVPTWQVGNGAETTSKTGNHEHKPDSYGHQTQCAHRRRVLPMRQRGGAGRHRRFCSTACRVANSREQARFESAGYNHPSCNEIESKSQNKSNGCKAKNRPPCPSRFSVPLDILGRGHRWPNARKLDRATWQKILWREGCQ
jgi:hypothetical protein